MTLSIAIAGAAGRMGQALARAASEDPRFRIVGVTERPGAHSLGVDIGILSGLPAFGISAVDDVAAAVAEAQVWLDFTTPAATVLALEALEGTPVRAAIVGTTGLNAEEEGKVAAAAARLAIVRSGNFSVGVTLLAELVRQAAARLGPEWDIEIAETHHRRKIDGPSGTALLLGEAAAAARGQPLKTLRLPAHENSGTERSRGGIGFSVQRGGGVVGDHAVSFFAERESLTFSHRAMERSIFADGALAAALWAAERPPGLYSMRDVLGL
jgi:4-hydroxy-tetrahydrodipicolinate reductase